MTTKQATLEVTDFDKEIDKQRHGDTLAQFRGNVDFFEKVYNYESEDPTEMMDIVIPPRPKGFNHLQLVPRFVDEKMVLESLRETYQVETARAFTDPKLAIGWNARNNKKNGYAFWVRHRQITDKNLRGLSAVEIADRGIWGTTLLERLLLEDKNRFEGNKPLDQSGQSLCDGTRFVDGTVPIMSWRREGKFVNIDFRSQDYSTPYTGTRQVITADLV